MPLNIKYSYDGYSNIMISTNDTILTALNTPILNQPVYNYEGIIFIHDTAGNPNNPNSSPGNLWSYNIDAQNFNIYSGFTGVYIKSIQITTNIADYQGNIVTFEYNGTNQPTGPNAPSLNYITNGRYSVPVGVGSNTFNIDINAVSTNDNIYFNMIKNGGDDNGFNISNIKIYTYNTLPILIKEPTLNQSSYGNISVLSVSYDNIVLNDLNLNWGTLLNKYVTNFSFNVTSNTNQLVLQYVGTTGCLNSTTNNSINYSVPLISGQNNIAINSIMLSDQINVHNNLNPTNYTIISDLLIYTRDNSSYQIVTPNPSTITLLVYGFNVGINSYIDSFYINISNVIPSSATICLQYSGMNPPPMSNYTFDGTYYNIPLTAGINNINICTTSTQQWMNIIRNSGDSYTVTDNIIIARYTNYTQTLNETPYYLAMGGATGSVSNFRLY